MATDEPDVRGFKGLRSRMNLTQEQRNMVEENLDRRIKEMDTKGDTRVIVTAFQSSI